MEKSTLISVLEQCYDPEIPIDLWNLGLIYDIQTRPNDEKVDVVVTMSLTTPGCHMGDHMARDIKSKLESLDGVGKAEVNITFDPPWNPEMMSNIARKKLGLELQQSPGENHSFEWE